MFQPKITPFAAWTDYTPSGPWADGTVVTRNADGVGFTYNASMNALIVNPNLSASIKNANNFMVTNIPAPSNPGDTANKAYVDAHSGGGGLADAPSDGSLYGRLNAVWTKAVPLAGGTMTGLLTLSGAPTVSLGAATKGYVDGAVPTPSTTTPAMDGTGAAGSSVLYARGDHVHPTDSTRAPLASPTFTGTPAAPTPATADNSTTISTTAFVKAQGYALSSAIPGASSTTPAMDGTGAAGSSTLYSRGDHVHPTDTTRAPLASPAFTGTPTSTTPATADNSTNIATTAYVKAQGYLTGNQTITLSTDVTGSGTTSISSTVVGLQGKGISTTAPSGGQVLQWNSGTSLWTPTTPSAAGAGGSSGQVQYNNGGAFGGFTMGGDATLVTSTGALTLATVNSNVGAFQGLTVNGKGLVTAATSIVSTTTPLADSGSGAVGTSTNYARADHVHPLTAVPGSGRFQYISATQVQFAAFNGDLVKISGVVYSIPTAGVNANNTSCYINGTVGNLAASTVYYVYIFNNSGTLTLDFSSTVSYTTDTTSNNNGVQIKSGDNTRSLVGMVYTNSSAQFVDSSASRTVISWYNRVQKLAVISLGNNSTSSVSATYVQMGASACTICAWGEDLILASMYGQAYTSTSGQIGSCAIAFDSTTGQIGNQFIMVNDNVHLECFSYCVWFNIATGAHSLIGTFYASLSSTASTLAAQNVVIEIAMRG